MTIGKILGFRAWSEVAQASREMMRQRADAARTRKAERLALAARRSELDSMGFVWAQAHGGR